MYTVEWLEQKSFRELKAIAYDCQIVPVGDRRCRQTWIDALVGIKPPLLQLLEVNSVAFIEQVQEPIAQAEISPGVTFSAAFLACYSPPQFDNIFYKPDTDGQLSLFDFEVAVTNEPPDPDDFDCLDDFYEAMSAWDVENLEPLEISLDSMTYWAPCPEEWYWPPQAEDSKCCPCGAMPAAQCDGTTAIHIYPDRIVFTPCYRQLDAIDTELVLCDRVGGRSPPGGDVYI